MNNWFINVDVDVACAHGEVSMLMRAHRVHLPTLGLDGQVYVCMCMGRYSV